ncbi:MAG TPA: hypothetical protein VLA61_20470 [Ideonella sp.]|uniref:hypothetical protein n=1 Tax=Ideonella sp. TaxID=1929293 RepID=UPI002C0582CD|nr:hypothetical protein [Ideonella sp.]HSI50651.1 hypothetical protein [Ideonella sp.]
MAKKIDRSRIEAGRFELPKKLAFLAEAKVDYTSISEAEDGWRVELPATAVAALAKLKASLKSLKADGKQVATVHADALSAVTAAHEVTRKELASAQRKIKALEKKLLASSATPVAAASAPAKVSEAVPAKPAKVPKKLAAKKATVVARPAPLATAGAILPTGDAPVDVAVKP